MTSPAVCRACGHREVQHSAGGTVCFWNWDEYRDAPDGPWPCACRGLRTEDDEAGLLLGEPPERLLLRGVDRPDPAER